MILFSIFGPFFSNLIIPFLLTLPSITILGMLYSFQPFFSWEVESHLQKNLFRVWLDWLLLKFTRFCDFLRQFKIEVLVHFVECFAFWLFLQVIPLFASPFWVKSITPNTILLLIKVSTLLTDIFIFKNSPFIPNLRCFASNFDPRLKLEVCTRGLEL